MKKIIFLVSFIASTALSQEPDSFLIDTQVSSVPVAIYSLSEPQAIRKVFNPEKLQDSTLILELRGSLEGNLCGHKEIALQKIYNYKESIDPDATFDVKLLSFLKYERSLEFSDIGCRTISITKPFKTAINITATLDGDKRQWHYRFTIRGEVKTLTIALNRNTGWSWLLK